MQTPALDRAAVVAGRGGVSRRGRVSRLAGVLVMVATVLAAAGPSAAGLGATGLGAAGLGARAAPSSPPVPYASPVEPMRVVAPARLPLQDWLPGHRGIDLAARVGDAVVAPSAGVVSFAGAVVDRPVVSVRHDDGAITALEPVDTEVSVGDRVARGQRLGTVASAPGHCVPATCVHWGVRVEGRYRNPLDALAGLGRVVLLPRERAAFRRMPRCAPGTRAAS